MENQSKIITSLLNLSPKDISDISVNGQNILVTLSSDITKCIYCNCLDIESKGYLKRNVDVSSSVLEKYIVTLKAKRFRCLDCRKSFSDTKHLSPKNSSISFSSINTIMELLKSPAMTFREAARLTGISETSVVRLFDSHVHINRKKLPEAICVDEVYTKNTDYKNGKFSFIIYDFINRSVIDVVPSRKKYELHNYFERIDEKERNNVRFISMDMYSTYKSVAKKYFKKAIICVDHFHIIKHLNDDLNHIRIRVMKDYSTDSKEYYLLKRFNNLLFNENINMDGEAKLNHKLGTYANYRDLLNMILAINKDLYKGYELKTRYLSFDRNMDEQNKKAVLETIIDDFSSCGISEFNEFTTILKNWKDEILNSFSVIEDRRINSSVAESVNASISTLLFNSRGIRNHERRRKRIMYAINKDGFLMK